MEYVGRKLMKEVQGCAACFGVVEAYFPATGLFKVIYEDGDSQEMELPEVSRLLAAVSGSSTGAGGVGFDLNTPGAIDLNDESGRASGFGGLHGLDLNEGVNYILHEGLEGNSSAPKRKIIDLNVEASDEEDENLRSLKRLKSFDLNVEFKADETEELFGNIAPAKEEARKGKNILEGSSPPVSRQQMRSRNDGGATRKGRGRKSGESSASATPEAELIRILTARLAQEYAADQSSPPSRSFSALPPKAELPPSSSRLDLNGAPLLEFLSVYTFLRSFSTSLFLSPFEVDVFAASLISNDSTSLFDSINFSLLRALKPHLKSLSDEGSLSAHACLRHLNWDLLDLITWPVFLADYLLFHSPKSIPGLNLHEFKEFQTDYYKMPASAKVLILQHLCDDLNESEAFRSELNKRANWMEDNQAWKTNFFSSKWRKAMADGASTSNAAEEDTDMPVDDGNGDVCYLCKMEGDLLCCDSCPAAFHSRCVGVVQSLLPDGDWHCPECRSERGGSYNLGKSVRGSQLLGADPHGRHYYTTCDYLIVSDSCKDDEYSFSMYNGNDIPAVIAALESSSFHHAKIITAIRKQWSSSLTPNFTNTDKDGVISEAVSEQTHYVNSYEFGGILSSISKELTSKSAEDGSRSADQIISRQSTRVLSNRSATFSWSNMQNLDYNKEKCRWCHCCKLPQDEIDCLFLMNDGAQNFTSEVLGIQTRDGKKNHLVDVICHVMWIERRLQGLLSGPHRSHCWRKDIVGAGNVACLKKLLLQLELSLHRRALSAEWSKHVDSAATKGSASHFVRKSTRAHPQILAGSRSTRKCSKQQITPTPKPAVGVSLLWWRGGRASRELFNWKVLPRSSASTAGRQGGCKKIAGVHYSEGGDFHAKRMKYTAWRAAVEASTSVEHLALQVRELDANIRWNEIENNKLSAMTERESRKSVKALKNAVIRRRRQEGETVKYLIDVGRTRVVPEILLRYGSLLQDPSSRRKKYWLGERHVPLHLLKAYEEKRVVRAAKRDASREHPESGVDTVKPVKKRGFEYLFERAERLERSNCAHCNEDVLIREAVSCKYCQGLFHKSHSTECATSSSSGEPIYACLNCSDKNLVQTEEGKRQRTVKRDDQEKEWWMQDTPRQKRAIVNSSYWLNGLRISKRRDDERHIQFRSKMLLLLSGEDAPTNVEPLCSLCGEVERAHDLNYVACEACGVWFHGDALVVREDIIESIIGFNCHNCLHKRPPLCPHQPPSV